MSFLSLVFVLFREDFFSALLNKPVLAQLVEHVTVDEQLSHGPRFDSGRPDFLRHMLQHWEPARTSFGSA